MHLRLLPAILLLVAQAGAQTASITASQNQDQQLACDLQVTFDPGDAQQQAWFKGPGAPGATLSNYRLYVVLDSDSPDVRACDESKEYLDAGRSVDKSKPASACVLPGNNSATCPSPGKEALAWDRFYVPLLKPLRSDLTYLLVITGVGTKGSTNIPFTRSAALNAFPNPSSSSQLKVTSNVALRASEGQRVTAERATAEGPKATSQTFSGQVVNRAATDGIQVKLDKDLPSGKTSQITVKGLTDYYGTAVEPKGKIAIQGAPANATDAFITTSFSVNAGVHSTPAFSATGAVAPWHPAVRALFVPGSAIQFDPSVNFDVGSASAQTKNSIILPSPLSLPLYFGLPSLKPPRNADTAQELIPVEGKHPVVLNLSFGPRLEVDTKYGGLNALGSIRGELYLYQFSQTSKVKQAALASGNPAMRDLLELPSNGFSLAPYVEGDGGGHVTSNTVTVGKSSADVPAYDIGRVYVGVHGIIQAGIFSFNLDSSWVDLLSTETIAYTANSKVLLRRVSGWQPNSTVGGTVSFDQAKHYGLTLSYQDGRCAPNWQYLNKVTAGLKVTY